MIDELHEMTWDLVMPEVISLLEADTVLTTALGGLHIYAQEASRPIRIPSVVWDMLSDDLEELFNVIGVQFDYFAENKSQAVTIERRLRFHLHRNAWVQVGDIKMDMEGDGAFSHDYPDPGVIHRSLRFLFQPCRRIVAEES